MLEQLIFQIEYFGCEFSLFIEADVDFTLELLNSQHKKLTGIMKLIQFILTITLKLPFLNIYILGLDVLFY